jgi:hypothetical protein
MVFKELRRFFSRHPRKSGRPQAQQAAAITLHFMFFIPIVSRVAVNLWGIILHNCFPASLQCRQTLSCIHSPTGCRSRAKRFTRAIARNRQKDSTTAPLVVEEEI